MYKINSKSKYFLYNEITKSKFHILSINKINTNAISLFFDEIMKQIKTDLYELMQPKMIFSSEVYLRRKRIISNIENLKINSNVILSEKKISFAEFIVKNIGDLIDFLLELLEAYDLCCEYNKPELFYSIIDMSKITDIIQTDNEIYKKKIYKNLKSII